VLRVLRAVSRALRFLLEQGVRPDLPAGLKKRVRLTNGLSVFGAFVMFASIPFDRLEAPPWMVAEDVLGGVAYLCFPFLNRLGWLTGARLLCLFVSNMIVLGNAALLGHDSGAEMVFVALAAVPFALFDLRETGALIAGVAMAAGSFAVGHSHLLARFGPPPGFSATHYYLYSAAVTFVILLYANFRTSVANAETEEALRRDIAERLRAESELERTRQSSIYSAKMAALGEMSGNIGHEVNNPLAAILLRAQRLNRLAERGELSPDGIRKTASEIERTVHRIKKIVDSLRSFARDGEADPMRPESVLQIVNDTVDLCAQRFQQHAIALEVGPIAPDLAVSCRSVQISQILLNLLSNAYDAVETQSWRRVQITVDAGEREVLMVVTDTGPGIPEELQRRIMEPFFTTKGIGKGTGLGLSVSKGIAEAHGGSLVYDSGALETRFVLTLPRASMVLDQDAVPAP
jgi:signal transduction histidine kinase